MIESPISTMFDNKDDSNETYKSYKIYIVREGDDLEFIVEKYSKQIIIGFLAGVFDKNFSKDSRMTIMFMVAGATFIFEILTYLTSYIFLSINVEMLNFIKILLIEIIYNILLTIILSLYN